MVVKFISEIEIKTKPSTCLSVALRRKTAVFLDDYNAAPVVHVSKLLSFLWRELLYLKH